MMQADETGATALVCLYCGAEQVSAPPYAVAYCHCRSVAAETLPPRMDAARRLAA
jgi:hypothetical protein